MNEIWVLRHLRHPNIIELHEVYESEDAIQLVLELARGSELAIRPKRTEPEAAAIIKPLLEAVAYCHAQRVIHHDIKPCNIIMKCNADHSLQPKLIDFGLATIASNDSLEISKCGTPGYIAPEVFQRLPCGEKVDVFSLGIVLYILYTASFDPQIDGHSTLCRQ
jgi:serine/threonine protein kinase